MKIIPLRSFFAGDAMLTVGETVEVDEAVAVMSVQNGWAQIAPDDANPPSKPKGKNKPAPAEQNAPELDLPKNDDGNGDGNV